MLDANKHTDGRLLPYINNISLRWNSVDTSSLPQMRFKESELERYGLQEGDVLVCEGGEPGRSAVWDGRLPDLKFQKAIHRVRFHGPFVPKILVLYLEAIAGTTAFESLFTGGGIRHLTRETFAKLAIPDLPFPEQQRIADCLTSLDEVIAAQGRKVEALKAHKRGLMQQLFPREGETRPRLRFPEFRDAPEWRVDPLSRYIQTLDAGVSVNSGDRPALEKEVGILKTSCVTNGVFDHSENKVVLEAHELRRVKEPVRANTIIISRMNTIALVGANAFVERDMPGLFLPDRLWAAKATGKGHPRFLAYVLGSDQGRAALSELAAGSSGTMKNIGKTDVLALKVSAPVLAEQQRIADCLASLDTRITAESKELAALKTHKQGLMQQLFPAPEAVSA